MNVSHCKLCLVVGSYAAVSNTLYQEQGVQLAAKTAEVKALQCIVIAQRDQLDKDVEECKKLRGEISELSRQSTTRQSMRNLQLYQEQGVKLAAKTEEVEELKKDLAARSKDLEHTARQRDELNEAYKKVCESKHARVHADLIEQCCARDMQMLAMIDELQELRAENKQLKKDNVTLSDSLHKAQTDVDYARTGTGAVARELNRLQGNRSVADVLRIALDDTLTENKQLKRAIARLEGRE